MIDNIVNGPTFKHKGFINTGFSVQFLALYTNTHIPRFDKF